jgi:tetratricopeptide (TPR) repeat protein
VTANDPLQLAMQAHKAGRFDEAEPVYRGLLSRDPNNPRLLHLLGTVLLQKKNLNDAIPLLQRAAAAAGNVAEVHFTLADALRFAGRFAEAEQAYRKTLQIRALFPSAHNGLGLALVQQNKVDSAILSWQRAIQLKSDYAEAHANLGAALAQQKKYKEASEVLRKAVQLKPNFAPAHNNLANVFDELEETDEAIREWRIALQLNPNYFDALVNISKALTRQGKHDESLALIDRAVALKPNDPDARFLRGLDRLLKGDLLGGFADYQFRLQSPDLNLHNRTFPQPTWAGESLHGKTILLHTEQGLGDTFQFIRYAPLLARDGAKVIVECPPDMTGLLKTVPGVSEVIARHSPLPPFDVHASVLSLPMLFGTTLETIPATTPYLSPDSETVARWADLLASDPPGKRVGLVWSGNPKHVNDQNRSIPLRMFDPLAAMTDHTFFSLQKDAAASQVSDSTLKLKLVDHTARLTDFSQTAALISQLDLMITVDTSVAHLSGALGKPTWVLLPKVPDWRWMLDRGDSPWYPSMKLLRQPTIGDWASVIERVQSQLRG